MIEKENDGNIKRVSYMINIICIMVIIHGISYHGVRVCVSGDRSGRVSREWAMNEAGNECSEVCIGTYM